MLADLLTDTWRNLVEIIVLRGTNIQRAPHTGGPTVHGLGNVNFVFARMRGDTNGERLGETLIPYIQKLERLEIDQAAEALAARIETPGQMAYVLFRLWDLWCGIVPTHGRMLPERFSDIAELSGVVHEAWAEWRARHIVPYEKLKMEENGDV